MFRLVSNWNNFSRENSKKKKLGTKRKAKDSKMLLIKLLHFKQAIYSDTQTFVNTKYKILIFSSLGSTSIPFEASGANERASEGIKTNGAGPLLLNLFSFWLHGRAGSLALVGGGGRLSHETHGDARRKC